MKYHILYADNRRPLKFSGELLGENNSKSKDEIFAELNTRYEGSSGGNETIVKLSLYRTTKGKIVLHEQRFNYCEANLIYGWETPSLDAALSLYPDIGNYITDSQKSNGSYGKATVELMRNVLENHPEFEELWVESID